MRVFLSHSSKDKALVRRLNKDLLSHGFETWLDEEKILQGESIPQSIEKGLKQCQAFILFVSRHSLSSKWVNVEWQSKIFEVLNKDDRYIIPLLIDDSPLPHFIQHHKYADFRREERYEESLSLLLGTLNTYKHRETKPNGPSRKGAHSILDFTKEFLRDLEGESMSLPILQHVPIVGSLKRIPRSGKRIRLSGLRPAVRIRSVYDHILSVAHAADVLLPNIEHGVRPQEFSELARCIAYHEINEIVLGDIPTYTSLTARARNENQIYAEERLRSVEPKKRERIANEFIWLFLSEKHRRAIDAVNAVMADQRSALYVSFKMLDKIDPIVATWRYLHHYRGELGATPKEFNSRMRDFYENPDVKSFLIANKCDRRVYDLVLNLQDRRKSWDYYEEPGRVFGEQPSLFFEFPDDIVRSLIEGISLFHDVPSRRPARTKRPRQKKA